MDSNALASAINTVLQRLVALTSEDAQLRAELRCLAQAVLEATSPSEPAEAEPAGAPSVAEPGVEAPVTAIEAAPAPCPPSEPTIPLATALAALTLGQGSPVTDRASISYPERWAQGGELDLSLIETRCRLKTEGARWAAARRRLLAEGASYRTEIEPLDQDIISRAKAIPECFLWMCHPTGPTPADPGQWEVIARCFETLADALSMVRRIQEEPEASRNEFERSLDLLAEAQSALRVAIGRVDDLDDTDQLQAFNWLRAITRDRQVFIQRYMRIDDPADPDRWADLDARIETLESDVQDARRRNSRRRKALAKVRHKASLISADPDGAAGEWHTLIETVESLVDDGMHASNRDLRELLIPIIDDLPDVSEVSPGFQAVLNEIDRYMAAYPPPEVKAVKTPTPDVRAVANRLRGKSLVLIGGDRREGTHQTLKAAFGLKDLLWIETREHQSIEGFEPYVARPDVAVVLLAIRWSSHSYGDVKGFCDRHGKPLVRLPGGYGLNQIAAQIMRQCSERLPGANSEDITE